jgi:hypothetical protein
MAEYTGRAKGFASLAYPGFLAISIISATAYIDNRTTRIHSAVVIFAFTTVQYSVQCTCTPIPLLRLY